MAEEQDKFSLNTEDDFNLQMGDEDIMKAVEELYDRIVNPDLLVRRINIADDKVIPENEVLDVPVFEQ